MIRSTSGKGLFVIPASCTSGARKGGDRGRGRVRVGRDKKVTWVQPSFVGTVGSLDPTKSLMTTMYLCNY